MTHIDQEELNKIIMSLRHFSRGFYYEELASTNDEAVLIEEQYGHSGIIMVAKNQTKGRGRLNRSWFMTEGDLAMSLIIGPPFLPKNLGILPMIPALALIDTLADFALTARLKWPNDIVIADQDEKNLPGYLGHYRKLGGILIENVYRHGRLSASIIGIGVNIIPNPSLLSLVPHAGFIKDYAKELSLKPFLIGFLAKLDNYFDRMLNPDFEATIIALYIQHCETLGRMVTVDRPGHNFTGKAIAINQQGALVVDDGRQHHIVTAGDVVVR